MSILEYLVLASATTASLLPPHLPRANTTIVFSHGEGGYDCIRIPSIVNAGSVLVAFAECRRHTGDGCNPTTTATAAVVEATNTSNIDVCTKRSSDGGRSWSPLAVAVADAGQPTAVYDDHRHHIVLNCNAHGGKSANLNPNLQAISKDGGETWSPPTEIDEQWPKGSAGSAAGPGVGLQLSNTNPYAPGRLLFIGHRGPYVEDFAWFSDDGGTTYTVSTSSLLNMDEPQLVELPNGTVVANMRNRGHSRGIAHSTDGGQSFGAPW